jgi:threonine aldolase
MTTATPQRPRIDLFSDTVTRPTRAMREAMLEADVGDEQLLEDPTTNALQDHVAELLGTEAALFMPSGAMCNIASFSVHCRPGDEVVLDAMAHPVHWEVGAIPAVTGAQLRTIDARRGIFTPEELERAIHPPDRHHPRTRVVSIEQTTNAGGGAAWTLDEVDAVARVARDHHLAVHIDGARLLNAVVATGTPAAEYARRADSVWIDLSKGLGAPVGAVLAGSRRFIDEAWRVKQRLGGAMRQSGVIAAAGLYALHNHVNRLQQDHLHARQLAERIATIDGVHIDLGAVHTNIVVFDIAGTGLDAHAFLGTLLDRHGVRLSDMGGTLVRAVTHLDVTGDDVAEAGDAIADVLAGVPAR